MLATLILAPLLTVTGIDDTKFATPVKLTADDYDFAKEIYPSPVIYDLDGDGKSELVIGDLRGYLQIANRTSVDDQSGWGPLTKMKAVDGTDLKFDNW